jgi:thioredoxin reductase (NADPH)
MDKIYDVLIIGAGPAGLSAAIYAGRSRLSALLIEKDADGGQIVVTHEIENYPGGMEHESGPSLVARMVAQVKQFGADRVSDTIIDVNFDGDIKTITGQNGTYKGKHVIIASGAQPRPIGCPGEKEFIGKGVSYCATCDANFFEDFEVFVVGGGDSAVEEAMYLTKFARKVTIIHRRDELRAAKSIQEKAFANPKLEFMWDSTVEELKGDGLLQSMVVKNIKTGEIREIHADEEDGTFGVFVFVGLIPNSTIFEGKIKMDGGYIPTDEDMRTNVPGIYAAGDIRVKNLRQVVTAAADGAIAAVSAEKYLASMEVFNEEVIEAKTPVLLVFWTPVVEKSIAAVSMIEQTLDSAGTNVALSKLDPYRYGKISEMYKIVHVPTAVLFNNGQELGRVEGEFSKEDVEKLIKSV